MLDNTPKHGMGDPNFDAERDALTTNSGEPVPDDQNSRTASPEGSMRMDDYLEQTAQVNRVRTTEVAG